MTILEGAEHLECTEDICKTINAQQAGEMPHIRLMNIYSHNEHIHKCFKNVKKCQLWSITLYEADIYMK